MNTFTLSYIYVYIILEVAPSDFFFYKIETSDLWQFSIILESVQRSLVNRLSKKCVIYLRTKNFLLSNMTIDQTEVNTWKHWY